MPEQTLKRKRQSSPRFPFIPLRKALERAEQLEKLAGNYPALVEDAKTTWGYKEKSSGGIQTVAALKAYGLIEESGDGKARKISLTSDALRYLREEREAERQTLRQKFALSPSVMAELWSEWKSSPPGDPVARSHLKVDKGFAENAAQEFLTIYKDNIGFSNLGSSSISSEVDGDDADETPEVKVGDYVQWTSGGVDQFRIPRRVDWVSDDKSHIRVHGSPAGIPGAEVTVTDPPAAAAQAGAQNPTDSGAMGKENTRPVKAEINVYVTGGRLQITAYDVDAEGVQKLKQMLDKYEEILKLME